MKIRKTNREHDKKTPIVFLIIIVMCILCLFECIQWIQGKKQKETVIQNNTEAGNTTSQPKDSILPTEEKEPTISYQTLKKDVVTFLTTYSKSTNGSYEETLALYEETKALMTPHGAENNLDDSILEADKTQYRPYENLTHFEYKNPVVYIQSEDVDKMKSEVHVWLDAEQILYRKEKKMSAFPYQFSGLFIYDTESGKWLCDDIFTCEPYKKGLVDESTTIKGD